MLGSALLRRVRHFVCYDVSVFAGKDTTWWGVEVGTILLRVGRVGVASSSTSK